MGSPVREVVRRRQAQRLRRTASTATSTPATATRSRSTGRASPATPAPSRTSELLDETCRVANLLRELGVAEGRPRRDLHGHGARDRRRDARVRAHRRAALRRVRRLHRAVAARPHQRRAKPRCSITADGAWRRGAVVALKDIADEAIADTPSIEHVLVLRRTEQRRARCRTAATSGGTTWCRGRRPSAHPRPSTARTCCTSCTPRARRESPRGIMHTTGGYLTQVQPTHKYVFRLEADSHRPYWCTADVGWVHGALVHRRCPPRGTVRSSRALRGHAQPSRDPDWLWSIVEKNKVTLFYTAPTAIRMFMKWADESPAAPRPLRRCACSGPVGEPINPEAWVWYYKEIGGERCPVVDTWWQTETGAIMISPLPGATTFEARERDVPAAGGSRRASSTTPASPSACPAVDTSCSNGRGWRCCSGIWVDPERYRNTYWCALLRQALRGATAPPRRRRRFLAARPGRRHHARVGAQHLDHRGRARPCQHHPDRRRGRGRRKERTLRLARRSPCSSPYGRALEPTDVLVEELRYHVAKLIGPIAKPKSILFTEELPEDPLGQDHAARVERGPRTRGSAM